MLIPYDADRNLLEPQPTGTALLATGREARCHIDPAHLWATPPHLGALSIERR